MVCGPVLTMLHQLQASHRVHQEGGGKGEVQVQGCCQLGCEPSEARMKTVVSGL